MGRACSKYGGEENCIPDFAEETGRKEVTRKSNVGK
jgi:hypothetical protein